VYDSIDKALLSQVERTCAGLLLVGAMVGTRYGFDRAGQRHKRAPQPWNLVSKAEDIVTPRGLESTPAGQKMIPTKSRQTKLGPCEP
jgi:hypothetical protein